MSDQPMPKRSSQNQSTAHPSAAAESPHRHISFTAHYTGYIWFQEGISHAVLASKKGRFLAKMVSPIETWAEAVIGDSMRSTLRQRHGLIDRQLDQFLAAHPDGQVLEIATGLSPRGWRYRQKYPQLNYVEADLPDMAAAKRSALQQIESPPPRIEAVDLFGEGFQQLLETFDETKPLLIISEGLVNYFTKDMLQDLWTRLSTGLRRFPVGIYLTDIYPEPITRRLGRLIWQSSKLLRIMSRSAFAFHFVSPNEIIDAMQQAGFTETDVFQPTFENSTNSNTEPSNTNKKTKHSGDLVWVIQAKV